MFDYLSDVGRGLREELIQVYWILLVPLVLGLIVLEFLKEENPNIRDILRRTIVSVLLLYSFEYTMSIIATIGDGITDRIDGLQKLWEVLKNLGPNYRNTSGEWFNLRETTLYFFSIAAYIIAYLGFFVSVALIHFVWTILFVCSPLMILAYVSRASAHATTSLYKGLIQVIIWKVLWSILGVLLLKLAMNPQVTGMEDYLMSIIINLSIGISMLFIPVATKSLINDGMQSAAGALAAIPAMAVGSAVKFQATALAKKFGSGAASMGQFAAKPLTNPIVGRAELFRKRIEPKLNEAKQKYSELFMPEKYKELLKKEKGNYERRN